MLRENHLTLQVKGSQFLSGNFTLCMETFNLFSIVWIFMQDKLMGRCHFFLWLFFCFKFHFFFKNSFSLSLCLCIRQLPHLKLSKAESSFFFAWFNFNYCLCWRQLMICFFCVSLLKQNQISIIHVCCQRQSSRRLARISKTK